jgi:hypothetical protein
VFLTSSGLEESDDTSATKTFGTTVSLQPLPTATIDPSALATSNGDRRVEGDLGTTSRKKGVEGGAIGSVHGLPSVAFLVVLVSGIWCLVW